MPHFLQYWTNEQVAEELDSGRPLDHTASDQLNRLAHGDVVWVITVKAQRLLLFGRLVVADVVSQREANAALDYHPYDAKYHALAEPGTIQPLRTMDITGIWPAIRLESKERPRLPKSVTYHALQTMRQLTEQTALVFDQLWGEGQDDQLEDEDAMAFPEGKVLYRLHKKRERRSELVQEAKRRALAKHGKLMCEVCGFDFHEKYGSTGKGFIEIHHTKPVSELDENEEVRVEDLVPVCSNCHRMLHRRRPWLEVHELRRILKPGD